MGLYKDKYNIGSDIKNTGFDYTGQILRKSISNYLYQFEHIAEFLDSLESAVNILYDSVKIVKNHTNFTVDKDERNIN